MPQNINIQNNTGTINIYNTEDSAQKDRKTINIASVDKYSAPLEASVDFSPWGKDMYRVAVHVRNSLIGQVLQRNNLTYSDESKAREIFAKIVDDLMEFKRLAEEELMHSAILVPKIWHRMASYEETSELSPPESIDLRYRYHNPEIHDDFMGGRPRGMTFHPVEDHFPWHDGIVKKAAKEKRSWYRRAQAEENVNFKTFTIGNIGASSMEHGTARSLIRSAINWLDKRFDLSQYSQVDHDFVDLRDKRDFLEEEHEYSAVIVHFICDPKGFSVPNSAEFSRSPYHSPERWASRLASTNADFIFVYSDGLTALSATDIGNLPGYNVVTLGSSTFMENYVYVKEGLQELQKTAQTQQDMFGDPLAEYYESGDSPIQILEQMIDAMEDRELIEYHIQLSQIELREVKLPVTNVPDVKQDELIYVLEDEETNTKYVINSDLDEMKEANEWMNDIWDIESYVILQTDRITEVPGELYHGTAPDRVRDILANGIEIRDETRGTDNTATGNAVFTSDYPDEMHYDWIFAIDMYRFLEDKRTAGEELPEITKELPVEEADLYNYLGRDILGIEEYYYEVGTSGGIFDTTWIIYENIPPEYITLYHGELDDLDEAIAKQGRRRWYSKDSILKTADEQLKIPFQYREFLNELDSIAQSKGLRLYAVGGFVRDLLLGKTPKDLDVVAAVEDPDVADRLVQQAVSEIVSSPESIKSFVQSNYPPGKKVIRAELMDGPEDLRRPGFIPLVFSVDYDDHSTKKVQRVKGEVFETSVNPSFLLATELGSQVPRGESFGIFAVNTAVGEVEIAYPRAEQYESNSRNPRVKMGTLEEDGNRRDFGMNALYLDARTGEISDPTGHGKQDIKEGVIRITNEKNMDTIFKDDPLRILRAFRFMAKLGFQIDPKIIEYIKVHPELMAMKGDKVSMDEEDFIPKLSAERIREEFLKIMAQRSAPDVMRLMNELGVLKYVIPLPDEAEPWEFEQINPHHFENVWDHTLSVMDAYQEILDEYGIDDQNTRVMGNLVALLHDTGKLIPEKGYQNREMDGDTVTRRTFVGHPKVSKGIAETVLDRLKFPTKQKNAITKMVLQHDRVLDMSTDDVPGLIRYLRDLGPEYKNMLLLSMADRKAHSEGHNDYQYLKDIYEDLTDNEAAYRERFKPWTSGNVIKEMFATRDEEGNVVLNEKGQILKTIAGEYVGIIKNALTEHQIDGYIENADQGIQAVKVLKEVLDIVGARFEEVGIALLDKIVTSPPYDDAREWLSRNYIHLRKLDGKPLLSPFLDGFELKEMGFEGKDIGSMKQEILARMLSGDIVNKEQAIDFAQQMKSFNREAASYRPLRFSEFNAGRSFSPERKIMSLMTVDEKIDTIIEKIESGAFDPDEIDEILEDPEWSQSLRDLYAEDPEMLLELYKEIRDEGQIETIAELQSFIKEADVDMSQLPEQTQYGEVIDGIETVNGNIIAGFGEHTDEVVRGLELINQTSYAGQISNLWIGVSNAGSDHLGVYEEELGGQGFRININKVNTTVEELLQNVPEEHRESAKVDLERLVYGEVMVHEFTHAMGAKDEGAPVSAEKNFLAQGIQIINSEREARGDYILNLDIKEGM